jgi:hypothetical protein
MLTPITKIKYKFCHKNDSPLISRNLIYSTMNSTESLGEIETGSYLEASLYRVPKKNHDAITQNLKKFILWFEISIEDEDSPDRD